MTIDDTLPFCWNDDILFAMVPVFRILESQYSRILKNSYDPHKRKFQNSPRCIFSDRNRERSHDSRFFYSILFQSFFAEEAVGTKQKMMNNFK